MEELRKSYKSGITAMILSLIFIGLNLSLFYIYNNVAVLIINVIAYLCLAIALAFYIKMMMGYVILGRKYSKSLEKSTYGILTCIILELLLLIILYFANIENSSGVIVAIAIALLIIYIVFAIFKLVFGISVYKMPVKSNTKSTLSIFSMLFGISMLTIVGIIFLPYIKIMEIIFQTLFLKDTYNKSHENKKKRNLWWWITSLIVYIIIIGLLGYFFYSFILLWRNFI